MFLGHLLYALPGLRPKRRLSHCTYSATVTEGRSYVYSVLKTMSLSVKVFRIQPVKGPAWWYTSVHSSCLLTYEFISVCSFLFCRWQINLVSAFLVLQPFFNRLSFCISSNVQIWWFAISAKHISFPWCLIVYFLSFFAGWKKRQISSRQKINHPQLMKEINPF